MLLQGSNGVLLPFDSRSRIQTIPGRREQFLEDLDWHTDP
jgi:hypothetical protein